MRYLWGGCLTQVSLHTKQSHFAICIQLHKLLGSRLSTGENAYTIATPTTHPTGSSRKLKRTPPKMERPLQEGNLPQTSVEEPLNVGGEETAFSGVSSSIVDVLVKRVEKRERTLGSYRIQTRRAS
ncbi:uncharacterized protein PITG_19305 [Phytophthora infestans T30-4]|uniref:Uncharacterized protein n=1 Tax=Phytophthora infestans (strain T30-4) TaxID=403677 RepID=D0NZW9_PHYIT|nr:uncharacterized protein PITG_19305 [Phytophthora infestans T30-4]EEY69685.1 hypothetical protein PITG_19305 [Phytophthora infestans T30-4]|eukprot:XP_002997097.1 hypothetical protein PITG_19305 [Phytophthora infestans T30-4]